MYRCPISVVTLFLHEGLGSGKVIFTALDRKVGSVAKSQLQDPNRSKCELELGMIS